MQKTHFYLTARLILIPAFLSATVRFVNPTGAGSMNGSTWLNALPGTALQAAINLSTSGDEVWVACGTYFTTNTANRSMAFSMKNGVGIYGSFSGTESSRSQRNFSCGPCSHLSGEIGVAGVFDNSYHVISNANLNNSALIDGFVIRDANDNRAATISEGLGGGIYNNGGYSGGLCSPTFQHCVIRNNKAVFGAGIFNSGHTGGNANPIILDCIITNNQATDGGGGIDNFGLGGNASPLITNCLVYNNTALTAGGMYCWGGNPGGNSNPVILNSVFANNSATAGNAGGVIADNSNSGAGNSGSSNITLRNTILWGNTAFLAGPQFFNKGTGTVSATYSAINMAGQNPPNSLTGSGTGNIFTNPLFVSMANAIGPDNCWMTADDGLRLQLGSPCLNTGNTVGLPLFDLSMNERVANGIVDMGAYEYHSTIRLTTFLQGYYTGTGMMNSVMQNQNYIPTQGALVTDDIQIELRPSGNSSVVAATTICRLATNGETTCSFNPLSGNYYVVVKHRNSIQTWSASPISIGSSPIPLTFSTSPSQAFGNNLIATAAGIYALYSGDLNQDENIDLLDLSLLENDILNFQSGYLPADINGDGNVDLLDSPVVEDNISNFVFAAHP